MKDHAPSPSRCARRSALIHGGTQPAIRNSKDLTLATGKQYRVVSPRNSRRQPAPRSSRCYPVTTRPVATGNHTYWNEPMNPSPSSASQRIHVIRLPEVCEVTGLCRSMIYQLEAEQRFPGRIKIGSRAVGWLEAEVQAWLALRISQSRPPLSAA